jgi:hypothetical protein
VGQKQGEFNVFALFHAENHKSLTFFVPSYLMQLQTHNNQPKK